MNQWALRHSARKRLLNASMNELSVGSPDWEKSGATPRQSAQTSRSRETNSLPESTRMVARYPSSGQTVSRTRAKSSPRQPKR